MHPQPKTPDHSATQENDIPWSNLRNPVLAYDDWSVKDACMTPSPDGRWYLFFSALYKSREQVRSHVIGVWTEDWQHFSDPIFYSDGSKGGWVGMTSPDISRIGGRYILTYNSWGDKEGQPNQMFYAVSDDLQHWDQDLPLAQTLTRGHRVIDPALAQFAGRWYMAYKRHQEPCIAVADALGPDGWTDIGNPGLGWFENAQFLWFDGRWHLHTTMKNDNRDHEPRLFAMTADGSESHHWLHWEDLGWLTPPRQAFNTDHLANASSLLSRRDSDGHVYLLYSGRTSSAGFAGRGHNRLGLARSVDLKHWVAPPSDSD